LQRELLTLVSDYFNESQLGATLLPAVDCSERFADVFKRRKRPFSRVSVRSTRSTMN
jgi:hypothetical protein